MGLQMIRVRERILKEEMSQKQQNEEELKSEAAVYKVKLLEVEKNCEELEVKLKEKEKQCFRHGIPQRLVVKNSATCCIAML